MSERIHPILAACSIVSLAFLQACGGGSASSPSPVPTPTPDANVAGNYILTITASDLCATLLPAAAKVTEYSASMTQSGTNVAFNAVGRVGAMAINGSSGTVSGSTLNLQIVFAEQRGEPTYVYQLTGTGTGRVQGSSISGTVNGLIQFLGPSLELGQCSATDHRFQFTRQ